MTLGGVFALVVIVGGFLTFFKTKERAEFNQGMPDERFSADVSSQSGSGGRSPCLIVFAVLAVLGLCSVCCCGGFFYWIYSMLDPVNSARDVSKTDSKVIRMLVDRDVEQGKQMADYSRKWGKPLLVTSNVARLAVRRGYSGLLEILDRKFVVYPTIEEAVRAYAAMADRYEFLQNTKSAGRSTEA